MTVGIKSSLIVISATAVILLILQMMRKNELRIPDDKAAAMALLIEKLLGPRYFSLSEPGTRDSDGPWIGLEEARRQEDRVIRERHLGDSQRAKLERMISQLSEPRPVRMVGGYRIPLERLNLALDASIE